MRIIQVKRGKYVGEHCVYESVEDFRRHHPNESYLRWGTAPFDQINQNVWVEAMDGYILQCLYRRTLHTVKTGQTRFLYGFANVALPVWPRKNGTFGYYYLYGQYSYLRDSNMSPKNRNAYRPRPIIGGEPGKERKKLAITKFVAYVVAGMDIHQAYRLCYWDKDGRKSSTKVMELMQEEEVRQELQHQLQPFIEKVRGTFTEDRLLTEMEKLLDKSRPGSESHRENLRFIMGLTGHLNIPPPKKRQIEPAEWTEVKDPKGLLSQGDLEERPPV